MFDLDTLKVMNDRACRVKVEDNHNRECSWTLGTDSVVLHSAKLRNTVFLGPKQAAKFVKRVKPLKGKPAFINALIESYFQGGAV